MDNKMAVFNNREFGSIRVIEENGNYLFCGFDVAKALGYAKPRNAINTHCKGALKRGAVDYNIKCNTKKYGHHTHFRVKCNYHKTKGTEVEYEVLYTFYTI